MNEGGDVHSWPGPAAILGNTLIIDSYDGDFGIGGNRTAHSIEDVTDL